MLLIVVIPISIIIITSKYNYFTPIKLTPFRYYTHLVSRLLTSTISILLIEVYDLRSNPLESFHIFLSLYRIESPSFGYEYLIIDNSILTLFTLPAIFSSETMSI